MLSSLQTVFCLILPNNPIGFIMLWLRAQARLITEKWGQWYWSAPLKGSWWRSNELMHKICSERCLHVAGANTLSCFHRGGQCSERSVHSKPLSQCVMHMDKGAPSSFRGVARAHQYGSSVQSRPSLKGSTEHVCEPWVPAWAATHHWSTVEACSVDLFTRWKAFKMQFEIRSSGLASLGRRLAWTPLWVSSSPWTLATLATQSCWRTSRPSSGESQLCPRRVLQREVSFIFPTENVWHIYQKKFGML